MGWPSLRAATRARSRRPRRHGLPGATAAAVYRTPGARTLLRSAAAFLGGRRGRRPQDVHGAVVIRRGDVLAVVGERQPVDRAWEVPLADQFAGLIPEDNAARVEGRGQPLFSRGRRQGLHAPPFTEQDQ